MSEEGLTVKLEPAHRRLAVLHAMTEEGRLNDAAIDKVCGILAHDSSDVVRHEAAFILGDLKRSDRLRGKDADVAQDLREASGVDKSILVRHEVALALVNFPSEETVATLARLTKDSAEEVRSSALYALTEMLLS